MADRGPLPTEIQKRRIEVEIARLEHQVAFKELDIMQLDFDRASKLDSIDADKKEIEKQKELIKNLLSQQPEGHANRMSSQKTPEGPGNESS